MSGRGAYIVTYDIRDPRRLRRVLRVMRNFGDHIQLSVFRCELAAEELRELEGRLRDTIRSDEDQVLVIPLGPAGGDLDRAIRALGVAYSMPGDGAVVV